MVCPISADVVSNAMDSLMSHLPEEEKPKLPGHTPSTNKQSLVSLEERNVSNQVHLLSITVRVHNL